MKYKNITDTHTHSAHSFDGSDSCLELVKSAAERKAAVIAVTDHCDIDGDDIDTDSLCSNQLKELDECIEKYGGEIEILKGLEIGQGIYRKEKTKSLLEKYDYDFILGSLHNLENMQDFYFLDYSHFDVYELLGRYFEDLLKLAQWGEFDSLAHLTYPLRYICARDGISVDMKVFDKIVDRIFKELINNGKALEINTSGFFTDMKDTLPNIRYVKRFRELGGQYVTVGSDSHAKEKVCQGIETGMDIARESGFDCITVFRKRRAHLIEIK